MEFICFKKPDGSILRFDKSIIDEKEKKRYLAKNFLLCDEKGNEIKVKKPPTKTYFKKKKK